MEIVNPVFLNMEIRDYSGWKMGLEPTTFGTTIRRSNRLNYIHRFGVQIKPKISISQNIIFYFPGLRSNTIFGLIKISETN
jgi:hypothetical protein